MTNQRVAVVTGAAQGLGRAIATRLRSDGFELVLVDQNGVGVREVAAELDAQAAVIDITEIDAVESFASSLGQVDVLINNAGIWRLQLLASMVDADQQAVVDVNVMGTLRMTKALAPLLANSPSPSIVNLSSGAAAMHSPGLGLYPAAKAAIESMTRQWAMELRPVRVNAIGPGLIVTEGTEANYEGEAGVKRAAAVPVGRVGRPSDIADVASFLVSDQASYVSGQIIYVDGGISAGSPGR